MEAEKEEGRIKNEEMSEIRTNRTRELSRGADVGGLRGNCQPGKMRDSQRPSGTLPRNRKKGQPKLPFFTAKREGSLRNQTSSKARTSAD